jgi:hypothetical protein
MEDQGEKMLQEFISFYKNNCHEDVRALEEAVEQGRAVSMYSDLFKNMGKASDPTVSITDKLVHSARYFYFLGYCMHYNNGIPMLEIVNEWIDNGEKKKVINAVTSQKNLLTFFKVKGINLNQIAEYIDDKEIKEYAIDEEKKSTGVLKRLLDKVKVTQTEKTDNQSDGKQIDTIGYGTENNLSVTDWAMIFYYLDESGEKVGYKIDRIKQFITKNNVRNINGGLTTANSLKKEYHLIIKRIYKIESASKEHISPLSPKRIEKILPRLKNNKKALQNAKNDIVYLKNENNENE